MARAKRCFIDNGMYHIINRGNGKQTVFLKEEDYQAFKEMLAESRVRFSIKLYAFCLMPNHFHFVAQSAQAELYSEWMHWLTTTHAKRYLKHYGGSGHVWQGRFKSFLIDENEYFLTVLRYVESNPVRAGLVETAGFWKWSSFAERFQENENNLIEKSSLVSPSFWAEWVGQALSEAELNSIRNCVKRQIPYGRRSWQEKVCKILGVESLLKSIGRPKKKRCQAPL